MAPAPEEEVIAEESTPQPTEDSNSDESYEAQPDAMADLMSSAYVEARGFDIRPMTEFSNWYVNLKLALGYHSTVLGYVEYNLHVKGIPLYDSD